MLTAGNQIGGRPGRIDRALSTVIAVLVMILLIVVVLQLAL
jgi:hypothetical protein